MKFSLTIKLGNDAMQSGEDLAGALAAVAARLAPIEGAIGDGETGAIFDDNGNNVGTWEVSA